MTLSTPSNRVSYAGDGSTTAFAIAFLFLVDSAITAILRVNATGAETTWVITTDYTLSGAGDDAGGTLTAVTAPASGETLVIRRIETETQATDYPEGGAFPASAHETALDKLTMLIHQHSEELARALSYPDTDSVSAEIPNSVDRASKVLGFDSSGVPIASSSFGTAVTDFIATLMDDANAGAARATLVAAGTAIANIFSADQTFDGDIILEDDASAGALFWKTATLAADASISLGSFTNGGMMVLRDGSSGGVSLLIGDNGATDVVISETTAGRFKIADPGSGNGGFWVDFAASATTITNRNSSSAILYFATLTAHGGRK